MCESVDVREQRVRKAGKMTIRLTDQVDLIGEIEKGGPSTSPLKKIYPFFIALAAS